MKKKYSIFEVEAIMNERGKYKNFLIELDYVSFDTFEQAEEHVQEVLKSFNPLTLYTILPIY
jgi:hypothetical protein